mgnify:CR=1 FL=1
MANTTRDDVENLAQGNALSSSKSSLGIMGSLLLVFIVLGFINLGSFWFAPMYSSAGWIGQFLFNPGQVSVNKRLRSEMWPDFRAEARSYADKNLLLTNVVLKKYLSVRSRLRNAAPFGDYIMVRAMRFLGFVSYFVAGLIIVGLALAEGWKKNAEKQLEFEQFSSTAYHFVLRNGVICTVGVFMFYLFVPHRIYIPYIAEIHTPCFLYSPMMWAILLTVFITYVAFTVMSNLSTNV